MLTLHFRALTLLAPLALAVVGGATSGCGVPDPPANTGGTSIPVGPCGRGLVSVETDYQSTNVSLIGWDGAALSPSFLSSASSAPGLSAALSGDVVLPTTPFAGDRVVLIQETPTAVLTWVSIMTGAVLGQLPVGTGFSANPQDYLELPSPAGAAAAKAYLLRYQPNPSPGAEPFDGGSDVLALDVHDPAAAAITARIDLAPALAGEAAGFTAHPKRAVLVGDSLYVLLAAYNDDFSASAPSRVVTIDTRTDALTQVTPLPGMHACLGLARSASGDALAVTCTGYSYVGTSDIDHTDLSEAGVVLLHRGAELTVARSWPASLFGKGPPASSIAFASESLLVFATSGSLGLDGQQTRPDTAVALEVSTGASLVFLQTQKQAFTLGEPRCSATCPVCFVADAEAGLLRRYRVDGATLTSTSAISPDAAIGLPPRILDSF